MTTLDIVMTIIGFILFILFIGSTAHLIHLECEYQKWLKSDKDDDNSI